MLVTFPHMGTLDIILKALFRGAGLLVLPPPLVTRQTLELGAKYSPETACLPFKIALGNYIQGLSLGADTIITCGGEGPCRLGYYAEVQKNILTGLGYKFDMIAIEPNIKSVWHVVNELVGIKKWRQLYQAIQLAGAKLAATDSIERQSWFYRPREVAVGQVDQLRNNVLQTVDAAIDKAGVASALSKFAGNLAKLVIKPDFQPLRIGLVGEIYVMLDHFANQDLVKKLGQLGAEVYGTILLGDYVHTHISKNRVARHSYQTVLKLAAPYLGHYIGGHGIDSIGNTIKLGQEGFDGIIQVFPITCMPEVIAKNILPEVSDAIDIPVLSLGFDEHTGTAGMVTRLEAFVDLLTYRRRKQA
ncbi:MAG: Protein of unknown function CoA enzyme activase [Firmicutes bacterium]|nr:Protein of unknown function CoA enzyme activase [Bacillota bacterium]